MVNVTEWLEAMYRAAGPDADKAKEALSLIKMAATLDDLVCKLHERTNTGDADANEIIRQLQRLDSLDVWAERDPTFREFGDLDEETLERFARDYERLEVQAMLVRGLAVKAGLIAQNDYKTDPVPLLEMFVPPA